LAQLSRRVPSVDATRPVAHRLEMAAAAVERGQHVVERDLFGLTAPCHQLPVRSARGEAVHPGAEARVALERVDHVNGRHQRAPSGVLGVVARAGDAHGQPVDALTVALDESDRRVGIVPAQPGHEAGIDIHLRTQIAALLADNSETPKGAWRAAIWVRRWMSIPASWPGCAG